MKTHMTLQPGRVLDIDYEAHPAFASLPTADPQTNARAEALIAEIDAAYDEPMIGNDPHRVFDRTATGGAAGKRSDSAQQSGLRPVRRPTPAHRFGARPATAIGRNAMDENTSALGQSARERVLDAILPRYSDRIVIFSAHDPAVRETADDVIHPSLERQVAEPLVAAS